MKVLVTFAVDAEFAPWRKLRKFRDAILCAEHRSRGVHVLTAQIGCHTAFVFLTGMGISSFDSAITECFKLEEVDLAISSGLAGSLKESYPPLTIICPLRVASLKDATGTAVTESVFQSAVKNKATAIETLLTSSRIIDSHEEKARLSMFADAVDMESAHILDAFLAEHIPVGVIRAISDGSKEDLPIDFEKCLTSTGKIKKLALLKELAAKPPRVPELIKFGLQSRAAAERLVDFLDRFIQALTPETLRCEISERATP